jgi:hypothetical protein
MLSTWGLPYAVVEATACHHAPSMVPHAGRAGLDTLGLVHVADVLAEEAAGGAAPPLDTAYLDRAGITARQVDAWRAHAARIAAGSTAGAARG